MKIALLAAALVAVVTPASAHVWDLKLGVLNTWCKTNTEDAQGRCTSYIMGVWHGVEVADLMARYPDWQARGRVGQSDPPLTLVCIPKGEPLDRIIDGTTATITAVLKQFPNDANGPADATVINILMRSYPCRH
jgi:hypothetical protein